jgi:hypothetical protein
MSNMQMICGQRSNLAWQVVQPAQDEFWRSSASQKEREMNHHFPHCHLLITD